MEKSFQVQTASFWLGMLFGGMINHKRFVLFQDNSLIYNAFLNIFN